MKHDLVIVWWYDAANGSGWESLKDMEKAELPLCISTGFLVHMDTQKIVLCSGINGDEAIGYMGIPLGMVVKKKFVKY